MVKKIYPLKCRKCNKKFSVEFNRKDSAKYCSHSCYSKSIIGKISIPLQKARKKWMNENRKQHCINMKNRNLSGDKNPFWKGNNITYGQLHRWIIQKKGKAKLCIKCKSTKIVCWANKDQKYARNLNDYIALCLKCHMKHDRPFFGTRKKVFASRGHEIKN